jgi:hypothetical protein
MSNSWTGQVPSLAHQSGPPYVSQIFLIVSFVNGYLITEIKFQLKDLPF